MATGMGLVAQRHNLSIDGLQIQVIKEMTAEPVRRIGTLKTRLVFPNGKALSVTDRDRLEAAARACPVKQSLHPDLGTRWVVYRLADFTSHLMPFWSAELGCCGDFLIRNRLCLPARRVRSTAMYSSAPCSF
jgi:hypothetical protein